MDKQKLKITSQLQTHLIHGGKTVVETKTEEAKQWYFYGFQTRWQQSNNLVTSNVKVIIVLWC